MIQQGPWMANYIEKLAPRMNRWNVPEEDLRQERVFAISDLDARGGTVRHMMFDGKTREMWFGTDGGTVGKIVVP